MPKATTSKPAVQTAPKVSAPRSQGASKKNAHKGICKTVSIKEMRATLSSTRPRSRFHKRNLTHFVRWPRYVRMQRQKRVLMKRLKTPPALNQFNHPLDRGTALNLFRLFSKMRPEERKARQARRAALATQMVEAKKAHKALPAPEKPIVVKYGLNHVTRLVETNKAKFVAIAHDVDPVELVVWLPALCRHKGIPCAIVRGKSRLGTVVHKKTASCVALTNVRKEDQAEFAELCKTVNSQFNNNEAMLKQWGVPILGSKRRQYETKLAKKVQAANAK